MSLGIWMESRLLGASLDLAVLAVLVWAAVRLLRPRPRLAALLWVVVLAKPLVGLVAGAPLALDLGLPVPEIWSGTVESLEIEAVKTPTGVETTRLSSAPSVPWLVVAWMLGVVLAAGWAVADRVRLRSLVRAARPAPSALRVRLLELADRLGVRTPPRLLVTDTLESPALAGTLEPVILLPAWLAESGSDEQLDWALRHELMHRKMRDPWAGALRELVRILFFFHPVAWWASRQWEEAAELACDRALVASEDDAVRYAERLYEMLAAARGRRQTALASGLFASRTQIGRRIEALLGSPLGAPARLSSRAGATLCVLAAAVLLVGLEGCRPSNPPGHLQADVEIAGPEGRFKLDADGHIAWDRNYNDIRRISPGGFVTVREVRGDTTYQVDFRPLPGGEIERTWSVNGEERPYNHEARVWQARALPRVAAIVDSGRMSRVFRPIQRIEDRLDRVWRRLHV